MVRPYGRIHQMTKRRIVFVVAGACPIAVLYLFPVYYIIMFVTAQSIPQDMQSQLSTIQVAELDSTSSGVLIRARNFEASQVLNEPFPTVIKGHSPGSAPTIPLPRIRTTIGDYRDWYSTILTVVYFPAMILAAGGSILFGIVAISVLYGVFRPLISWRRITGSVVWAGILISFISITYFLAIWPVVLREYYGKCRPLIWDHSPLTSYLSDGFSKDLPSHAQPMRAGLVVVNGMGSPVEVYADGLRFDQVPAKGIRVYRQLREFSRLTTVESSTQNIVEDFRFQESGESDGILIYNVNGIDKIHVEGPPIYR
jgi:hypothetical protein